MSSHEQVHDDQPNYGAMSTCDVKPIPTVIYQPIGDCPQCHVGILKSEMTCLSTLCCILLFILFVPLGFVCLCLVKGKKCPICGYTTP